MVVLNNGKTHSISIYEIGSWDWWERCSNFRSSSYDY